MTRLLRTIRTTALVLLATGIVAAAEPAPSSPPLAIKGLIVTSDRCPDTSDIESFARSVCRIERTRDEQEEAEALFRWMQTCVLSGPPAYEARLKKPYTHDAGRILFVHGYSTCDGQGATMAQLWRSLGRRAHRTYIPGRGHTITELRYPDRDGVTRWHVYDTHGHWYGRTEDGRAPSAAEIARRPDLVPLRNTWSGYRMTAAVHSWTPSVSRWGTKLSLHPQESVALLWNGGGRLYTKEERLTTENRVEFFKKGGVLATRAGAARFTYTPDFTVQKLEEACLAAGAAVTDGEVANATGGTPATLEFAFPSPYIYTGGVLKASAACAGGNDRVTVSVRFKGQEAWTPVATHKGWGDRVIEVDLGAPGPGNIRGHYTFRLKIELASPKAGGARLKALSVERWGQLNRLLLPHVRIGWNEFILKAGTIGEGWAPKITISWAGRGGEEFESRTTAACPYTFHVFGARRRFEEPPIDMRSITFACVRAPDAKSLAERGAGVEHESAHAERLLAVARSGDPGAYDALRKALRNEDDEIRYWAVHGLAEMGDARAVDHIITALTSDSSEKVRLSAANALGMLRAKEAVPALITMLSRRAYRNLGKEEDKRLPHRQLRSVRWQVAASLGEIGDPRAVQPLIAALEHASRAGHDHDFVVHVIDALGILEAREATPVLRKMYGTNKAGNVGSRACVKALATLVGPDDEDRDETVALFLKALGSGWTDIRTEALVGLRVLGATDTVPRIRTLLEREREPLVRAEAERTLRALGAAKR